MGRPASVIALHAHSHRGVAMQGDGVCLLPGYGWLAGEREDPKRDTAAVAAAAGGNGKTLTRRCLRASAAKGRAMAQPGSTLRSPQ